MTDIWTVNEQGDSVARFGTREATVMHLSDELATVWCKTNTMNAMVHRSPSVEAAKAWCEMQWTV